MATSTWAPAAANFFFCSAVNGKWRNWTAEALPSGGRVLPVGIWQAHDGLAAEGQLHDPFDAAQPGQHRAAADRVVDFDHHRGDKLAALWDQRVIGRDLVGDLLLPALFDEEHLVNLMQHRVVIFEIEGDEGPDLDPAQALHLAHALAQVPPLRPELVERHEVVAGEHVFRHCLLPPYGVPSP